MKNRPESMGAYRSGRSQELREQSFYVNRDVSARDPRGHDHTFNSIRLIVIGDREFRGILRTERCAAGRIG